jgi:hypothetical protein
MIYKCIYIVNQNYKHKNFGRVGAIKVEQLELLLLALKTYWDYSNDNHLRKALEAANSPAAQVANYEL